MNLDLEAAKAAPELIADTNREIVPTKEGEKKPTKSEVENLITKALGVLQENGVYACMLFLYSRTSNSDKAVSEVTRKELITMTRLSGKEAPTKDDTEDVLNYLTDNICNDLDILLFTKQLWEQTLIYARYSAKARE
jgi:hypothetical protein